MPSEIPTVIKPESSGSKNPKEPKVTVGIDQHTAISLSWKAAWIGLAFILATQAMGVAYNSIMVTRALYYIERNTERIDVLRGNISQLQKDGPANISHLQGDMNAMEKRLDDTITRRVDRKAEELKKYFENRLNQPSPSKHENNQQ